ncbi:MAG: hypothetical protein AABW82_05250 [Nanoarchaeota archaeon]
MNKRGRILPLFLIFLLVLLPFASADLQDTLQQKADNLQDKADKAEDLANTLSDKDSRTEYLSKKWGEFINKTPIGKAIILTTATVKTADPLIELVFGEKFNFNLNFLLIFSIWLFIFAITRKIIMPSISSKIKIYSPLYHGVIAFVIASLFGGTKLIPLLAKYIILSPVNMIPSLFAQIFILLLISCLLIYYTIKIKYPYYEERQRQLNDAQNKIIKNQQEQLEKEEKKIAEGKGELKEIERQTGIAETKHLSPEEREKRKADTLSGLEIARKLGESLDEETEDKVKKTVERTKLDKTEKLNKTKKLNR